VVLHLHIASILNRASEATGIPASTIHRGQVKVNPTLQVIRAVIAQVLFDDGIHPDDIALAFNKTPRSIYSWLATMRIKTDEALDLYLQIKSNP